MRFSRTRLLAAFVACVLVFPLIFSCGGDDDDTEADLPGDDDTGDDDEGGDDFIVLENDVLLVNVSASPFGFQVLSKERGLVTETLDFGAGESLAYVRNQQQYNLENFAYSETTEHGVTLVYRTTEGNTARVTMGFHTDRTLKVEFGLEHNTGFVRAWQDIQLFEDEAIYGLMERIHWFPAWSEEKPREIGSLNRRGEWIPMMIYATIGAYAPFYHSSQGYGLHVDTTFYGYFDVGHFEQDRLRFVFSTAEGRDPVLTYYLFYGPSHDGILDEYTALTGRPFVPPQWAFLHWRWRDAHQPVTGWLDGNLINGQVAEDVLMYEELGIPAGNYMIDRPWTPGEHGFAEFSFDQDRFPNARPMLQSLDDRGYHVILWGAPWAIGWEEGQNGWEAERYGYYAPHQRKHIDFTDPAAYLWWKMKIRDFVRDYNIHGWKLDRGEEDQPSFWWDVYHDGRTGDEVRNDYPVMYQNCYHDAMTEAWGDDFVNIIRAGWTGSHRYGAVWAGDTRGAVGEDHNESTDLGLRSLLLSQLHCSFMGYSIWTSDTGGYYEFRDREVFARWLQFSAFSPIMEIGGIGDHAPWNMPTEPVYDEEMIDIYRTYTRLHHDLVEYISRAAVQTVRSGRAVTRPLVFDYPDDPNVREMWDEYFLGADILVAPVWRVGQRRRQVYVPEGRFVNYWNPDQTVTGPTTINADAPLDRIPFYIRKGAEVLGRVW